MIEGRLVIAPSTETFELLSGQRRTADVASTGLKPIGGNGDRLCKDGFIAVGR